VKTARPDLVDRGKQVLHRRVSGHNIGGCLHAVLDGTILRLYELDGTLSIRLEIVEEGS